MVVAFSTFDYNHSRDEYYIVSSNYAFYPPHYMDGSMAC